MARYKLINTMYGTQTFDNKKDFLSMVSYYREQPDVRVEELDDDVVKVYPEEADSPGDSYDYLFD